MSPTLAVPLRDPLPLLDIVVIISLILFCGILFLNEGLNRSL